MSWVLGVAPVRRDHDLRNTRAEREAIDPRLEGREGVGERIGLDFPVGVSDETFAVERDGTCWRIHVINARIDRQRERPGAGDCDDRISFQ